MSFDEAYEELTRQLDDIYATKGDCVCCWTGD